jgi:UDP-3-O-[3-hydroxymyristoyl] N-acetylglucosamine deacetylase
LQFETSILRAVETSGIGLHSGVPVSIRILPARASTGIVFSRTDLDGFTIPAQWKYVARVSYATSLMRQGVLLSTTEHLLSVLYSLGIDNARIEIDNLEVPILDGSGLGFVELLRQAGVRKLRRPRRYLRICQAVEVCEGDKRISILPSDQFEIDCTTSYDHPLVGRERMELSVTPERYASEIAPARTFGFERDLADMRDMGLIRGASLDNAVCFGPKGVLNPGGLRFPDECCRHKVLDLIGDLALLGRPLIGRVIAERAGHAMHAAVVERIMQDPSCYELVTSEEAVPQEAAVNAGKQPVGQQQVAPARRRPWAATTPLQA